MNGKNHFDVEAMQLSRTRNALLTKAKKLKGKSLLWSIKVVRGYLAEVEKALQEIEKQDS